MLKVICYFALKNLLLAKLKSYEFTLTLCKKYFHIYRLFLFEKFVCFFHAEYSDVVCIDFEQIAF